MNLTARGSCSCCQKLLKQATSIVPLIILLLRGPKKIHMLIVIRLSAYKADTQTKKTRRTVTATFAFCEWVPADLLWTNLAPPSLLERAAPGHIWAVVPLISVLLLHAAVVITRCTAFNSRTDLIYTWYSQLMCQPSMDTSYWSRFSPLKSTRAKKKKKEEHLQYPPIT